MNEVFAFIAAEKAAGCVLSITVMCVLLEVSRSGFYAWDAAVPSARARRRAKLAEHVRSRSRPAAAATACAGCTPS